MKSETCTYILPNLTRVEITGVDLDDCFEIYHERREEFLKFKVDIELITPRLLEYYKRENKNNLLCVRKD